MIDEVERTRGHRKKALYRFNFRQISGHFPTVHYYHVCVVVVLFSLIDVCPQAFPAGKNNWFGFYLYIGGVLKREGSVRLPSGQRLSRQVHTRLKKYNIFRERLLWDEVFDTIMAECEEDRNRYRHPRLAYRPNTTDDEDEAAAAAAPAVESAAAAAHLFGGSFQFIVQEQAKSMVAIQVPPPLFSWNVAVALC